MTIILKELWESDCGLAGNWPEEPPNPKVCKCMHAAEKSDTGIVPKKEPNKTCQAGGGGSGGKAGDRGKFLKRRLRPVRRDRGKH